jgi:hypothetical protein
MGAAATKAELAQFTVEGLVDDKLRVYKHRDRVLAVLVTAAMH